MDQDRYLTTQEAARRLHVHPDTLRRRAAAGKLVEIAFTTTAGGQRRYLESDVDALAKRGWHTQAQANPEEVQELVVGERDVWTGSYGQLVEDFNQFKTGVIGIMAALVPMMLKSALPTMMNMPLRLLSLAILAGAVAWMIYYGQRMVRNPAFSWDRSPGSSDDSLWYLGMTTMTMTSFDD